MPPSNVVYKHVVIPVSPCIPCHRMRVPCAFFILSCTKPNAEVSSSNCFSPLSPQISSLCSLLELGFRQVTYDTTGACKVAQLLNIISPQLTLLKKLQSCVHLSLLRIKNSSTGLKTCTGLRDAISATRCDVSNEGFFSASLPLFTFSSDKLQFPCSFR